MIFSSMRARTETDAVKSGGVLGSFLLSPGFFPLPAPLELPDPPPEPFPDPLDPLHSASFFRKPPCKRMWPLRAGVFLKRLWQTLHSTGLPETLAAAVPSAEFVAAVEEAAGSFVTAEEEAAAADGAAGAVHLTLLLVFLGLAVAGPEEECEGVWAGLLC